MLELPKAFLKKWYLKDSLLHINEGIWISLFCISSLSHQQIGHNVEMLKSFEKYSFIGNKGLALRVLWQTPAFFSLFIIYVGYQFKKAGFSNGWALDLQSCYKISIFIRRHYFFIVTILNFEYNLAIPHDFLSIEITDTMSVWCLFKNYINSVCCIFSCLATWTYGKVV